MRIFWPTVTDMPIAVDAGLRRYAVYSFVKDSDMSSPTLLAQRFINCPLTSAHEVVSRLGHSEKFHLKRLKTTEKGVLLPYVDVTFFSSYHKISEVEKTIELDDCMTVIDKDIKLEKAVYEEIQMVDPKRDRIDTPIDFDDPIRIEFGYSADSGSGKSRSLSRVRTKKPDAGYIILAFKTMEHMDNREFVANWKTWTGVRFICMQLPRQLALRRISFYRRLSETSTFSYILLIEISNLLIYAAQTLNIMDRIRLRLCGYVGIYRETDFELDAVTAALLQPDLKANSLPERPLINIISEDTTENSGRKSRRKKKPLASSKRSPETSAANLLTPLFLQPDEPVTNGDNSNDMEEGDTCNFRILKLDTPDQGADTPNADMTILSLNMSASPAAASGSAASQEGSTLTNRSMSDAPSAIRYPTYRSEHTGRFHQFDQCSSRLIDLPQINSTRSNAVPSATVTDRRRSSQTFGRFTVDTYPNIQMPQTSSSALSSSYSAYTSARNPLLPQTSAFATSFNVTSRPAAHGGGLLLSQLNQQRAELTVPYYPVSSNRQQQMSNVMTFGIAQRTFYCGDRRQTLPEGLHINPEGSRNVNHNAPPFGHGRRSEPTTTIDMMDYTTCSASQANFPLTQTTQPASERAAVPYANSRVPPQQGHSDHERATRDPFKGRSGSIAQIRKLHEFDKHIAAVIESMRQMSSTIVCGRDNRSVANSLPPYLKCQVSPRHRRQKVEPADNFGYNDGEFRDRHGSVGSALGRRYKRASLPAVARVEELRRLEGKGAAQAGRNRRLLPDIPTGSTPKRIQTIAEIPPKSSQVLKSAEQPDDLPSRKSDAQGKDIHKPMVTSTANISPPKSAYADGLREKSASRSSRRSGEDQQSRDSGSTQNVNTRSLARPPV